MITFEDITKSEEINSYIKAGNNILAQIGYTEHGLAHAAKTAKDASEVLQSLGCEPRECELASIAGYMHDIGNIINRSDHAHNGANMAFTVLNKMGMETDEIIQIVSAIGHHDEKTASPVNKTAAALILADKSDVRRTRVRDAKTVSNDIHDRVNYAVEKSILTIDNTNKTAILDIAIDTNICAVMDCFEIFLTRMVLCRKAASFLGLVFELVINGTRLL